MLSTETSVSVPLMLVVSASHCLQMLLWVLGMCWICGSASGWPGIRPFYTVLFQFDLAEMLMALVITVFTVSITALRHECHRIWLAPNHLQALTDIQPNLYYAWQCTTTSLNKLLTLAHCSLCTSYATSCTSSACRAIEQPSHYPVLLTAGYTCKYPDTSSSCWISKIWIRSIPTEYTVVSK